MRKSKKSVTNHTIAGMNNEVALLLIVIVAIIVILFFNRTKCTKESFITEHMTEGFQNEDENKESNIYISSKNIKQKDDNIILTIGSETYTIPFNNFEKDDLINLNNFYKKGSTIESETIKLLKKKNETIQNDYDEFRKTILDSKTYQLKNSIPKIECPPCINPKVNVDAALCKKCPPIPEPQTCDDDNNKSQPACVNKYTVLTRNIYKNHNNTNNNSNLLIEEEKQTKTNYNNKISKGLNTNNTNSTINNKTNPRPNTNLNTNNIVVEEQNFYNSLNKMNGKKNNKLNSNGYINRNNTRTNNNTNSNTNNIITNNTRTNNNNNTNNVRTNNNTNNVRTNNNTNNVRTNNNTNNVRTNNNTNRNSNINTIRERPMGELNHSFKLAAKSVNGYSF